MRSVTTTFNTQQTAGNRRVATQVLVKSPLIPPLGSPPFAAFGSFETAVDIVTGGIGGHVNYGVIKGVSLAANVLVVSGPTVAPSREAIVVAVPVAPATITWQDLAGANHYRQSFTCTEAGHISCIAVYLKRDAGVSAGTVQVKIMANGPHGVNLTSPMSVSASVNAVDVPTAGGWVSFLFSPLDIDEVYSVTVGAVLDVAVVTASLAGGAVSWAKNTGAIYSGGAAWACTTTAAASCSSAGTGHDFLLRISYVPGVDTEGDSNIRIGGTLYSLHLWHIGSYKFIPTASVATAANWGASISWADLPPTPTFANLHDVAVGAGTTVRIFAVLAVYPYTVYYLGSTDGGETWDATWTAVGNLLIPLNKTELRATYSTVYVKNQIEGIGVAIECFVERSGVWSYTSRQTMLGDIRDFKVNVGMALATSTVDGYDYLLFTAINAGSVGQLQCLRAKEGIIGQPKPVLGFEQPKGSAPLLRPGLTSVVAPNGNEYFLVTGQVFRGYSAPIEDDFEGYDAYWQTVVRGASSETWSGSSTGGAVTVSYPSLDTAGDSALWKYIVTDRENVYVSGWSVAPYLQMTLVQLAAPVSFPFEDEDFVAFAANADYDDTAVSIGLLAGTSFNIHAFDPITTYGTYVGPVAPFGAKKKNLPLVADWANIAAFEFKAFSAYNPIQTAYDMINFVKADPVDTTIPNYTGGAWDFYKPWDWYLLEDDASDARNTVLGVFGTYIMTTVYGYKVALHHSTIKNQNYLMSARVLVKKFDSTADPIFGTLNHKAGLAFRMTHKELHLDDGYVAVLDPDTDKVYLNKVVDGVETELGNASLTIAVDTWYIVGVQLGELGSIKIYAVPLTAEGDLWNTALITATDTRFIDGRLGFVARNCQARFDDLTTTAYTSSDYDDGFGVGATPLLAVANESLCGSPVGDTILSHSNYLYTFDRKGTAIYRAISPFASDAGLIAAGKLLDITSYVRDWSVRSLGGDPPQAGSVEINLDNPTYTT